jgi:hypothetical protein
MNVFDILVRHVIEAAHSNYRLSDMQALFEHVMDLGMRDRKNSQDFMHLWNETFDDLDRRTKMLVLYQMKLNTERRFEDTKVFLTKEYEEMRFEKRNDYERIVVEGECKKCGVGPLALPYLDYRKEYAYAGPTNPILLNCPKCDTENSLSISRI